MFWGKTRVVPFPRGAPPIAFASLPGYPGNLPWRERDFPRGYPKVLNPSFRAPPWVTPCSPKVSLESVPAPNSLPLLPSCFPGGFPQVSPLCPPKGFVYPKSVPLAPKPWVPNLKLPPLGVSPVAPKLWVSPFVAPLGP